jgi:hypothetical protein
VNGEERWSVMSNFVYGNSLLVLLVGRVDVHRGPPMEQDNVDCILK